MRMVGWARAAVLLTAPLFTAVSVQAQEAQFHAAQSGETIAAASLGRAVLAGGVYANLPQGSGADFLGIQISAGAPSIAYIGASSRFIFAASLSGSIEGGAGPAVPGQVIVWDFAGSKPQVAEFDVEKFLASAPVGADPAVRSPLEAANLRQQRLIFWGLLRPVALNLQAPTQVPVEASMREHLSPPPVAELRLAADSNPDSLPKLVADRFVAALDARDTEVVASLLHPDLFRRAGQAPGDWLAVRAGYARSLTGGPLPQRLQKAQIAAGTDWAHWQVAAGGRDFVLSLAALDGMPYVVSLEPPSAQHADTAH